MLKLAGESIRQEKIEAITYLPGIQNTGDLEAATHIIVPTSRPAIASAQYSSSKTLAAPSDARLVIQRLCARLAVTIDSLGTATHVYCSVRIDVDDSDHELFNMDWTSTGAKLSAVDLHASNKAVIFNLLKDGSAHTFYFLFWADAASQAVISLVQLWEGVGSSATGSSAASSCLAIIHTGFIFPGCEITREGTGSAALTINNASATGNFQNRMYYIGAGDLENKGLQMVAGGAYFFMYGTVATDLNYLSAANIVLRSEQ